MQVCCLYLQAQYMHVWIYLEIHMLFISWMCMYVYICVCAGYMCIYVHIVYTCTYVNVYHSICLYCLHMYVSVLASIHTCICMYIYVYVCICMYLHVLNVLACIGVYEHVWEYMYVWVYMYMYCIYWYVLVCICLNMHVFACICMYEHVCISWWWLKPQVSTKNSALLEVSGGKLSEQKEFEAEIKRPWETWELNTDLQRHMSPYLALSHSSFMQNCTKWSFIA